MPGLAERQLGPHTIHTVKRNHVPMWLRKKIRAAIGYPKLSDSSGPGLLQHAAIQCGCHEWLDHYGSAQLGDKPIFISEPYDLSTERIHAISQFAKMCNLRVRIDTRSLWNPPSTILVMFSEGE